jgi:pyruvyl transferase EpsO
MVGLMSLRAVRYDLGMSIFPTPNARAGAGADRSGQSGRGVSNGAAPATGIPDCPSEVGGTPDTGALLARLAGQVVETVRSLVPPASRCALLDYPNHANVGDNAIWLGERRVLRSLGAQVRYATDLSEYARDRLADRLAGRGTILMHGGGNLGDLWPEHQEFRERVIATFPDYPIIQLPQSICFRNPAALRRAKAVFDAHPNLTLLLRDRRSLDIARNTFRAPSLLCPDMALALGALKRTVPPRVDVLSICRADHESAMMQVPSGHAHWERQDWVTAPRGLRAGVWRLLRRLNRYHGVPGRHRIWLGHVYDLLSQQRLQYGRRLLSRGRVVVTDRLHGHVLSLMLGIPHVVIDDRYGKVRSFYETWTKQSTLAIWADSLGEVAEAVATIAPPKTSRSRSVA